MKNVSFLRAAALLSRASNIYALIQVLYHSKNEGTCLGCVSKIIWKRRDMFAEISSVFSL